MSELPTHIVRGPPPNQGSGGREPTMDELWVKHFKIMHAYTENANRRSRRIELSCWLSTIAVIMAALAIVLRLFF